MHRRAHMLAAAFLGSALLGCSFDWDSFDPRLRAAGGGASHPDGGANPGGNGGMGGSEGGGGNGTAGAGGGGTGGEGGMVLLGPWGTPTIVAEISSPMTDEDDPTFTADLLEVYFNSTRNGNGDIFVATRPRPSDPWSNVAEVTAVNTSSTESNQVIAPDGLTLWFNRGANIWVATRASRTEMWSTPTTVDELNTILDEDAGCVTGDGLEMLMSSTRVGGAGATDLWVAKRSDAGSPWNVPVNLAELNTIYDDSQPWIHPDGLTIYFDSSRKTAGGSRDLLFATRDALTDEWGSATEVAELNTDGEESDAWLSPDLRYIMFVSGEIGSRNIYQASR